MFYTYEEYITKEKALTIEQMETIHKKIMAEVGIDTDALEMAILPVISYFYSINAR